MHPRLTRLAAAPVIAAVAIAALSACSKDATSTANENDAAASPAEPSATAEPTSPGYVKRTKKQQGTRDTIGGVVSWSTPDTYSVTDAQLANLGQLADAFLVEHYLREDRYLGDFEVKPGEMDAYRKKVSPQVADDVEEALSWLDANVDTFESKGRWPTKALEKTADGYIEKVSLLFLNANTIKGGHGQGRFEFLDRDIFIANAEWGWSKPDIGKPVTYSTIQTRHLNNTGTGMRLGVYQVWDKIDGEWRIVRAGRRLDNS